MPPNPIDYRHKSQLIFGENKMDNCDYYHRKWTPSSQNSWSIIESTQKHCCVSIYIYMVIFNPTTE